MPNIIFADLVGVALPFGFGLKKDQTVFNWFNLRTELGMEVFWRFLDSKERNPFRKRCGEACRGIRDKNQDAIRLLNCLRNLKSSYNAPICSLMSKKGQACFSFADLMIIEGYPGEKGLCFQADQGKWMFHLYSKDIRRKTIRKIADRAFQVQLKKGIRKLDSYESGVETTPCDKLDPLSLTQDAVKLLLADMKSDLNSFEYAWELTAVLLEMNPPKLLLAKDHALAFEVSRQEVLETQIPLKYFCIP